MINKALESWGTKYTTNRDLGCWETNYTINRAIGLMGSQIHDQLEMWTARKLNTRSTGELDCWKTKYTINKGIDLMGNQIRTGFLTTGNQIDSLHIFFTMCIPPVCTFLLFMVHILDPQCDNDASSIDAAFHITLTSFIPPNYTYM